MNKGVVKMEIELEQVLEQLEGKSYEEGLEILRDTFSDIIDDGGITEQYVYCELEDGEEVKFNFTYRVETAEDDVNEIIEGSERWEIVD